MAERIGALLVLVLVLVAVVVPLLPLADPVASNVRGALQAPSVAHPFGTDALGRDLFARVLYAARLDLALALAAVTVSLSIGALIGALAGWFGGWSGRAVGWLVDVLLALPIYLLAMVLAAGFGNSLGVVVVATAMVNLPFYIRLTRLEVQRHRHALWLDAARMGGAGDGALLFGLVLPLVLPLLAIQATTNLGWAMLNAAGLSFIGIGVRPPTPEWGVMIAEGARFLAAGQWWLTVFPAAALVLAVLGFHLLGDGVAARLGRTQK